jgi:transposase-like protein
MKAASNVAALARELGIRRKWLYQWRDDALEAAGVGKAKRTRTQELESDRLRKRVQQLLELVGEQEAKLHFFESALRRVKARRQSSTGSGETGSSTPSGR